MKFSKIVFWVASIWGILIITPLYFMFDRIGAQDPPPITHPGFYYGFVGTAFAWQIAFLIIATNPVRFRPLMLAAILEKFTYCTSIIILVLQHRTNPRDLVFACIDLTLGVLFIVSYFVTPSQHVTAK